MLCVSLLAVTLLNNEYESLLWAKILKFSEPQCGVIDDAIITQITVSNVIHYVNNDTVAKCKLSINFTIIQYGRQIQFRVILETESETESWM